MNNQYLCHKPRICYACHKHFPVIFSFITQHWVCNQSNTAGVISGAGTTYPSGAPEFIPSFKWGSCYSSLVLCIVFCRSLFVLLSLFFGHCVLAVPLRFTDSDFPFGIFKLFFYEIYDSGVGIKAYINNESLSHSINTINKCLKIPKG